MISLQNLRASKQGVWLAIDFAMMFLLAVNLLLILFDALYSTATVFRFFTDNIPLLTNLYQPVHENFFFVDLGFIAIFLSEFLLRWIVAVRNKEYLRWYFFPFVHWYDLIGCIPVDAARIFRVLRIVSILYRLHKYQIVDFKNTGLFRFLTFYYNVFLEELSDRIVVKVLSDAQEDIAMGSQLIENITSQVLKPRMSTVTQWVALTSQHFGDVIKNHESGEIIRHHIAQSVSRSVREDPQIRNLDFIPVLGSNIEKRLETAVANIVVNSIVNLLSDIDEQKVQQFMGAGLPEFSSAEQELNQEILVIINEVLDLVKEHVANKRWQEKLNK
ncbi:MAG: ion transporter [Alteromonadaceae bacterium]|nr:ion transporter [Alteromonadaceae bacterium]